MSANGKYDNPDLETAQSLYKIRPEAGYKICLTNQRHFETGAELPAAAFLLAHRPPNVEVVFANDADEVPPVVVNLAEPLQD